MADTPTFDRRTVLRGASASVAAATLAGCFGSDDDTTDQLPEFIEIEDPPDAVYVPTHWEAMRMLDPIEAGDVAIAPMLSYPHPFWVVAGSDAASVQRVDPEDSRGVHLMFTVWDRETDVVLPVDDGAELVVSKDGDRVGSPISPWTMISQEMGFHFGDNVSLPEDGTYTVDLTLPPLSTRLTGDLDGRLAETVTASFEFEYDDAFRQEMVDQVEYLDESDWGRRGALEPMDHDDHAHDDHAHDDHAHDDHAHDDHAHDDHAHDDHGHHRVPYSAVPDVSEYPGTLLVEAGEASVPETTVDLPSTGDARVLATLLDDEHRLSEMGERRYLLVSLRTPYNRVPLADASLSISVERDGSTVESVSLVQTIDGTYAIHYGTTLPDVQPGDSVVVEIESPPQVARHMGYETAFLDMPPVRFGVPDE